MNILKFFLISLLSQILVTEVQAKITILSISGVSRSEISRPEDESSSSSDSANIFAGTANVSESTATNGDADCAITLNAGTGTCNTCTATPELFSACNQSAVYTGTELKITFKSDNTSGEASATDTDNNDLDGVSPVAYTAGSNVTITVSWDDICQSFSIGTDGQRCDDGSDEFYVGVDSNNDGTLDDKAEINFQILDLNDNDQDNANFDGSTILTGDGVNDYTLFPGDNKAFIDGDFPISTSPNLSNGIAPIALAFFSAAETNGNDLGCEAGDIAQLRNNLNYIEVSLDDDGVVENDKLESNLENGVRYVTTMALVDEAGNIGNFYDTSATCVEDQHTVRPREVSGLLSQNTNCFISTAAFGSKMNSKVIDFRKFRDQVLRTNTIGKFFVRMYYKYSPPIAKVIAESETLRFITRIILMPAWAFSILSIEYGISVAMVIAALSLFGVFILVRTAAAFFIFGKLASSKSRLLYLQNKSFKKKLFSFFLIFLLATPSLFAQPGEEDGFFDINENSLELPENELPPQEPPYTGNEIEEFEKAPSDPEDPYVSGNTAQTPEEIEAQYKQNPNKWKDSQRVPDEDRLNELSREGLFKISKKGEFTYRVNSSPQESAASVRVASATFPLLENPENGVLFEDIYGDEQKIMLLADYEWQFFRKAGKLGIKIASGLLVADGQGQLSDPVTRPDGSTTTDAKEDFTLFFFPNTLAAVYRLQLFDRQWLVPFGEIGISYFTFIESEEQGDEIKFGGAPHLNFAVGGSFLLDVLGEDLVIAIDRDYGINHLWLTAEYRRFEYLSGEFDFSDDIFSAGIMTEF